MSNPVPITSISVPILVVVALLVAVASSTWAANVFLMSRAMATQEHLAIVSEVEKNYLEFKIDNTKSDMRWMRLQGIKTQEQRSDYGLLEHSLNHMTTELAKLP